MKKNILLLLILMLPIIILAQSDYNKDIFSVSLNIGHVSTSGIDNTFKNIYDDYNNSLILITGVTLSPSIYSNNRFTLGADLGFNTGTSFANLKEEQYKRLDHFTIGVFGEYCFLKKENYNLNVKTGAYIENYSFLYTRKDPLDITSFSNLNTTVPIQFTINFPVRGNQQIGIFIQDNIIVDKGKTKITGIDFSPAYDVKPISNNAFLIGIKYGF
ncbi:MAG: hypothetical protein ACOXZK_11500 [Bacteroidales bacterium]|nr:hypothetical protein [Bacteroidales bacterium]